MKHILIVGNIIDGLRLIGPFEEPTDASEFGERYFDDEEWNITDLEEPNEVEKEFVPEDWTDERELGSQPGDEGR